MMSPNFANKSQTHERTCLLNYAQVCKIKQKIQTTHVLDSCHRCDKNCMGADGCLKKHGKMCLALRQLCTTRDKKIIPTPTYL